MNLETQRYNVIDEVAVLIKCQLMVMEIVAEDRRYRMLERNGVICHCNDCILATEASLSWLHGIRA